MEQENGSVTAARTSITRESVMILSTQVLFTEKCPGMKVGADGHFTRRS